MTRSPSAGASRHTLFDSALARSRNATDSIPVAVAASRWRIALRNASPPCFRSSSGTPVAIEVPVVQTMVFMEEKLLVLLTSVAVET